MGHLQMGTHFVYFHRSHSLAKQGDNTLGSVRLSVRPSEDTLTAKKSQSKVFVCVFNNLMVAVDRLLMTGYCDMTIYFKDGGSYSTCLIGFFYGHFGMESVQHTCHSRLNHKILHGCFIQNLQNNVKLQLSCALPTTLGDFPSGY